MATVADFLLSSVTPAMQELAIDYAGRSIHFTFDRMDYGEADIRRRLPRIVVGIASEAALEAVLRARGIAPDIRGRTHWRTEDNVEFILGGLRTDVKAHHVYPSAGRNFPDWFVTAESLVPVDQLNKADAYIQAFLVAPQVNHSATHRYIAILHRSWCNRWRDARAIHVEPQAEQPQPVRLTICGENASMIGLDRTLQGDIEEAVVVGPRGQRVTTNTRFSSVEYAHAAARPRGAIMLQIDNDGTHTIEQRDWIDLWLDDPHVYFAAWGNRDDYRAGQILPVGTATKVFTGATRTRNYSVLIQDLRPLSQLLT